MARLLLTLADQHGRTIQAGIELALKLSQDDLADMLGVARQSLNRVLKELQKQQLIDIAYSSITLRDIMSLQALAQGSHE